MNRRRSLSEGRVRRCMSTGQVRWAYGPIRPRTGDLHNARKRGFQIRVLSGMCHETHSSASRTDAARPGEAGGGSVEPGAARMGDAVGQVRPHDRVVELGLESRIVEGGGT